ncbi:ParM/StbA family protein [Acidithiobacillus thiooxidans]|uniref:ParM/StbA family protein n=1 Tax=Acidithiobacillus thiooxidans TaxID=930 RepID=UPI001C069DAE|nr:ParM/StbA family protein [Acidithiobacillus thiooxidans]MBU2844156.1 ParM/StbA family protein [Acidithiobacillus thiooxidans]
MKPIYACDDGYGEIKIIHRAEGILQSFSTPSRAQSGDYQQIEIGGATPTDSTVYVTKGEAYTVVDTLQTEDTRFAGFALSSLNRVLVAHALRQVGTPEAFELVVGLPLRDFYWDNGTPNQDLIAAKRETHRIPVQLRTLEGDSDLPVPDRVHVLPQSLVVAMQSPGEDPDLPIAVVDIGSRTTDITVVQNGKVDFSRCGTLPDLGVAAAVDRFQTAIEERRGKRLPNRKILHSALTQNKRIRINGAEIPEADQQSARKEALKEIAGRIQRGVERHARTLEDCDHVILIGGGALLLEGQFDWPHAQLHPQAVHANAMAWLETLESV